MISVAIDASTALRDIGAMLERSLAIEPVLAMIGKLEVENVKARIQQSKLNPWGGDWAPWAAWTAEDRAKKGNAEQGLLWDTGALLDSIHFSVDSLRSMSFVDIGSDLYYALDLQEGTAIMPAREFLGWNDEDALFYERILYNYIETGTP